MLHHIGPVNISFYVLCVTQTKEIVMSLILRYKLNEPTASLATDSSGNSNTPTNNGAVSFADPTYGNVAYFDGTSYLELATPPSQMTGNSSRTYSCWFNSTSKSLLELFGQERSSAGEFRAQLWTPERVRIYNNGNLFYTGLSSPMSIRTWHHLGITYDGTTVYLYINGSQMNSASASFATGTGPLHVGNTTRYSPNFGINGYMPDFRVYDDALSATEMNTLYTDGPNPVLPVPALTVSPRALNAKITVSPVDGATAYRLTSQKTGSTRESVAKSSFTDLNQTIPNLTPETEYTFRLYSTTGNSYALVGESTVTTLINSASNYDANDFVGASGRFDISSLDTASVGLIADVMNELFSTGDDIDIVVPGRGTKISKFVNRGGSVSIENSEALVAPFSKDAGAGQSVSLTLSDSSVVVLSYDETTEAITVGATSYTSGESFVLDGNKATIVDI